MENLAATFADARLRVLLLALLAGAFVLAGGHVFHVDRMGMPEIAMPFPSLDEEPLLPPLELPDPSDQLAVSPMDAKQLNALVPVQTEAAGRAAPFFFPGMPDAMARARDCLAVAAWYEAGDDATGERAVVQVVLNRVRHPAYPKSVCGVVFQGSERTTGCQFTFTCDGSFARVPSAPALARARAIALAALSGQVDPAVGMATHYHADYVVPRWRDSLVKVAQQGAHLFSRFPGYWGSAGLKSPLTGEEAFVPKMASLSPAHAARIEPDAQVAASVLADASLALPVPVTRPRPAGGRDDVEGEGRSTLDMQVDAVARPGSFALRALALCGSSARCLVRGWLNPAARAADTAVDAVSAATGDPARSAAPTPTGDGARVLAFIYLRNQRTREGAYWDCGLFRRADAVQCLPSGRRLEQLLAAS
jgi:spore germination cell wall hydrolase CwlJ-like protein